MPIYTGEKTRMKSVLLHKRKMTAQRAGSRFSWNCTCGYTFTVMRPHLGTVSECPHCRIEWEITRNSAGVLTALEHPTPENGT
jgi:predicted Zn-ribbon and HTH transcriptional regulator